MPRLGSKFILRYISTKEHSYFCGGLNHERSPSLFLRSVLFVVYAPAEVTMFLSSDISRNRLGASLGHAMMQVAEIWELKETVTKPEIPTLAEVPRQQNAEKI